MDVNELLGRLAKVRQTRPGEWIACCPAHNDRSPSLAVKENGGYLLIHCFGGCETADVMEKLGLELRDLFPERMPNNPPRRGAFTAMDALRCLSFESSIAAIAAADVADGKPIDVGRVCKAAGRIAEALEFVHGR